MTTEASPATDPQDPNLEAGSTATDQGASTTSDANAAPTSNAENTDAKPEAPKSLADVVRDVLNPEPKAPDASSAATDGQDKPADSEEKPADDADKPEAELPFHNHPRFKQLVEERNALKPEAENYRNITSFMAQNNLAGTEVAEGFEIMAAIKSRTPEGLAKARDYFATHLQSLNEMLGETLPADLQTKVDSGALDEADAKELARARAKTTILDTQLQARQQEDQETRQREHAQQLTTELTGAVNDWEKRITLKDPDYSTKKAKLVESQSRAIIQRTGHLPRNADEALQLVEAAYAEVNETLKSLTPKPKPLAPQPASISASVRAAPKSLRDVVDSALR